MATMLMPTTPDPLARPQRPGVQRFEVNPTPPITAPFVQSASPHGQGFTSFSDYQSKAASNPEASFFLDRAAMAEQANQGAIAAPAPDQAVLPPTPAPYVATQVAQISRGAADPGVTESSDVAIQLDTDAGQQAQGDPRRRYAKGAAGQLGGVGGGVGIRL